jgi:hypothetical protein
MLEYCDTPQSKEKRNWERKACLNEKITVCLIYMINTKENCRLKKKKMRLPLTATEHLFDPMKCPSNMIHLTGVFIVPAGIL